MRRPVTAMVVAAGVVTTGILTACSPASSSTSSSSSSSSTSSSTSSAIDGMVDIGSGRRIHATCAGFDHGGPTVVFVSGSRSAGDEWLAVPKGGAPASSITTLSQLETGPGAVFGQVTSFAPACAYDRPGTLLLEGEVSASTRVTQPTSASAAVADLHAWLTAAAVATPYVLVGHSWGGMIATLYAATYPSATAGLVLVDPATAFLKGALTPVQWQGFLGLSAGLLDGSGTEVPDYANSVDVVRVARVGRIPIVVLTASRPFDFGVGVDAFPAWQSASASLASALGARQVTDTASGHLIPIENPGVVVAAIRDVLAQAG